MFNNRYPRHEFECVMCIGTSGGKNAAVLMESSSGPLEAMIAQKGATDVAERMGFFVMDGNDYVKRRRYLYGKYRVNAFLDVDGSFDETHIQEI